MVTFPGVWAVENSDPGGMGSSWGQEDPLEEEMATHSSILAWRIPWTEDPSRLQSMGHKESDMTEQLNTQVPTEQKAPFGLLGVICIFQGLWLPIL